MLSDLIYASAPNPATLCYNVEGAICLREHYYTGSDSFAGCFGVWANTSGAPGW